ncbi:MAG: InlB B-repeat-containing protein, partial [Firmicutes bacterium]|nr:InlB B-repeat-containing protein [Bacillota bacterium]
MIKITKQKLRIIPLLIILFLLTTFFVACSKNANQNEDKNPPSPPAQKVWGIKYIGNSMTVDENSPLEHIEGTETILKRATKRGYLFQGWFLNENFSGDVMTKISPDFESENSFDTIYLYAKFDAESYKIIYHLNGGMLGENSPTMHTFGEKTKLVTPTLVGYSFGGWFDDDGYVENSELQPTKYTADINLSAKWNAKTFFIKYQLNGGKLGDNSPTEHEFNVETILVDAKRDGFKFEGWFDNEKFEGNALTKLGATDILSDITLYAKWSGETYKISFVDIDGSVLSTQIDEVLHTNGEETNLPSGLISNSYLRFGGWSSNIYGG